MLLFAESAIVLCSDSTDKISWFFLQCDDRIEDPVLNVLVALDELIFKVMIFFDIG